MSEIFQKLTSASSKELDKEKYKLLDEAANEITKLNKINLQLKAAKDALKDILDCWYMESDVNWMRRCHQLMGDAKRIIEDK